ncbi:glycosyltransferase, partial [Aerococcus loyolae]
MRILQINSVYKFGSTGRIVHNIHKYLLEKGHESYVIYGRGKKYKDKNVFKIGSIASQFIDFLFTRTMNKHGEFNIFFTK